MRDVLFVAVGGSAGALVRYGVGLAAAKFLGRGFPWGTLTVNVAGCFVMGIVMELMLDLEARSVEAITPSLRLQLAFWRQGVAIGFLGALTTFSTFGADTLRELESGRPLVSLANVAANLVLSLAAVWLGVAFMRAID
ncbi:MAG TPA: CrcB family protein [Pirellulaceae bacterium]